MASTSQSGECGPHSQKTLEIIEYLQPEIWWLETPRNGLLARRDYMQGYPWVDCDHCQFEDLGYQKPTRFFGSKHLSDLQSILCDGHKCPSLEAPEGGATKKRRRHRKALGGNQGCAKKEVTYYIPPSLVEYVTGLESLTHNGDIGTPSGRVSAINGVEDADPFTLDPENLEKLERVRCMRLRAIPEVVFPDENPDEDEEVLWEVAKRIDNAEKLVCSVVGEEVPPADPLDILASELKDALIKEFGDTSLSGKYPPHPLPVRGPFGEGEIWLEKGARPVSVPPFHLTGERRDALDKLVGECISQGKLESGKGPWNTPAFPVPKKVPGTYRLVQDLRPQNAVTIKDGHPLPRIGDMVFRQGKNRIWTVLDLVDGFHQMPMKKEHRYITCMSTPRGTQQWTVQVMGLKNAATQFQRMMEWVLRDLPDSDPYVDDTITGSDGPTPEQCLRNNYEAVRALLKQYQKEVVICKWEKSKFFKWEVEFCGHILRQGRRSPAPGKLLPIKNWELPKTVTELRGFLGLTNYFSEYVEHYAESAAPLMGKLQLNRHDGRKGSKVKLVWTDNEIAAFEELKAKLCKTLELFQPNLDRPFRLHCDASDFAIGAELAQEFDGVWKPVGFYSRKLAKSQKNWTPREKDTYAIVESLRKWSGLIGFQPVLVTTDHKSLENWVTEHVDTPSGPRGRRGRWHERLSQFDLQVVYIPGPENIVPDALSRWAYPATSSREDVSMHGSLEAKEEVRKMLEREIAEAKSVAVIRVGAPGCGIMAIAGGPIPENPLPSFVKVLRIHELDLDPLVPPSQGCVESGVRGGAAPHEVSAHRSAVAGGSCSIIEQPGHSRVCPVASTSQPPDHGRTCPVRTRSQGANADDGDDNVREPQGVEGTPENPRRDDADNASQNTDIFENSGNPSDFDIEDGPSEILEIIDEDQVEDTVGDFGSQIELEPDQVSPPPQHRIAWSSDLWNQDLGKMRMHCLPGIPP